MSSLGLKVETSDEKRGLVVHLTSDWSREHLEMERAEVTQEFLNMVEATDSKGIDWLKGATIQPHRWRYGQSSKRGTSAHLPRLVEAGDAWGEPIGS